MINFKSQTTNPVVLSDEIELTDEQLKIAAGAFGEGHDQGHDQGHDWHGGHRGWGGDWDDGRRGWGGGDWDDGYRGWYGHRYPHYQWSPYYQQWVPCYE